MGWASSSISSFKKSSNSPVPSGASWPSMMFSETPRILSGSEKMAASMSTSTVSSKEQRMRAPESTRLMPWRVIARMWPRDVITSHRMARWR